jgi:HSP20 family molecular chaperone IbpA
MEVCTRKQKIYKLQQVIKFMEENPYKKFIEDLMGINDISDTSSWDMFFTPNQPNLQKERGYEESVYELLEDEKNARYVFELAGMEKEEIDIELVDNLLVIKGNGQKKVFEYKITLQDILTNPRAYYKNGILEIVFEKTKKKVQKIEIQ